MKNRVKVLAFAGSTRKESFNKKLIKTAVNLIDTSQAEVTYIDLADFEMPLYNGDIETHIGLPQAVKEIQSIMIEHDAFIISSPEYNSSVTPLLKNVLDWTSRPSESIEGLACYKNKTCLLMSASPGGLGGLRGLIHVRSILQNMGVVVFPGQKAVGRANEAFSADGSLAQSSVEDQMRMLLCDFVNVASKLKED